MQQSDAAWLECWVREQELGGGGVWWWFFEQPFNYQQCTNGYNQPKIVYTMTGRCTFWRLVIYHILL